MIDATCNYINPYGVMPRLHHQPSSSAAATAAVFGSSVSATATSGMSSLSPNASVAAAMHHSQHSNSNNIDSNNGNFASSSVALYQKSSLAGVASAAYPNSLAMRMEMQYPPQPSSTGSASPNSSIHSASSSASVSPSIFISPAKSFASISSSPPASATSASPLSGSPGMQGHGASADLGAAAAAVTYPWTTSYSSLPSRSQFPYGSYASDYYGNMGMSASAAAAGAWLSHQDRLYQPWASQPYPAINFEEIAYQSQLQRRSVRCTCPNCANEMAGIPPIVGPDSSGRKRHICHVAGCERIYGKASHLKTHLRWHSGERPFACLVCHKRFSRSDELQRHGRTHTNYRPYGCPICSKKFSRSDHLSKHKKTHNKEKKTKKALAAEAKQQQEAGVKQEKPQPAQNNKTEAKIGISAGGANKSNTVPTSSATATLIANTAKLSISLQPAAVMQPLQLKTEQPELPADYSPYSNLYHHTLHTHHLNATNAYGEMHQTATTSSMSLQNTSATALDLWNNHYQQQQQSSPPPRQSANNFVNQSAISSLAANLHQHQQQQQQLRAQQPSQFHLASATSSNGQHYAALAMQSESQLAAEYGATISSNDSASNAYPGLLPKKSEYSAYADFSASAGYTATGGFHHHPHNAWAAAAAYQQHSHATA